jgi:hypothetical protein
MNLDEWFDLHQPADDQRSHSRFYPLATASVMMTER